jgi:hypothetical protein
MLNCAFPDSQGELEREAGGVTRPTDEPQGGEPRRIRTEKAKSLFHCFLLAHGASVCFSLPYGENSV